MSLDDPEVVHAEYSSENGLEARASVYPGVAGPDARDTAPAVVAEVRPTCVLEVGCGWGEFAARIRDELRGIVTCLVSPLGQPTVASRKATKPPAVLFNDGDRLLHLHPRILDSVSIAGKTSVFDMGGWGMCVRPT